MNTENKLKKILFLTSLILISILIIFYIYFKISNNTDTINSTKNNTNNEKPTKNLTKKEILNKLLPENKKEKLTKEDIQVLNALKNNEKNVNNKDIKEKKIDKDLEKERILRTLQSLQ